MKASGSFTAFVEHRSVIPGTPHTSPLIVDSCCLLVERSAVVIERLNAGSRQLRMLIEESEILCEEVRELLILVESQRRSFPLKSELGRIQFQESSDS
jgi:hypothetical protein